MRFVSVQCDTSNACCGSRSLKQIFTFAIQLPLARPFLPISLFLPFYPKVLSFRDSTLTRMTVYSSDAAALEAAGKKQVLKVNILDHLG